MPLTGELSDLSLAELIEFFCNQRKTGRLDLLYPEAPAHFFLQTGNVVHAEIGALRGIEAVYYTLTLANASFKFSSNTEIPQPTINQPWASVVLEGLRRMDEGISPLNPFPNGIAQPPVEAKEQVVDEAEQVAASSEHVIDYSEQRVDASEQVIEASKDQPDATYSSSPTELEPVVPPHTHATKQIETAPLFLDIQSSGTFAYGPWKLGAIFGSVVLVIAVIAVPWGWYARSKTRLSAEPQTVTSEVPQSTVVANSSSNAQPETTNTPGVTPADPSPAANESVATNSANAEAEKKAREARLREEARLKLRTAESASSSTVSSAPQPVKEQSPPAGPPKRVTVQVTYDENGRVTQASGGDATALRIARQKRFPAGKAGSATVTIPIN